MKRTVLLVDDDSQYLDGFASFLRDEGYAVVTATTASDAIDVLRARADVSVVLADLVLPETYGHEPGHAGIRLVEFVRSERPKLPIFVFSGYPLQSHAMDLARVGVSGAFSKGSPDVVTDVLASIKKAIAAREEPLAKDVGEPGLLEGLRAVLSQEMEIYAPVKARTIYIPQEGPYELIKPLVGFKKDIEKQLARFPFSKNVFLMMKFRETNRELGEFIVDSLANHGLRGVRADHTDWNITRNVYNPIAVLYCCKYGIALFDEAEQHQAYSPNVAYELGMLHYQNKHCLILRHASLPVVPFDLIKDLHETYEKDLRVRHIVGNWIAQVAINI
jgi:CheY-like chemotaxis protein